MQIVNWVRLAFLATVLFLSGCDQTYNWNQRIKVVIATPDGDITAETVQMVEMIYHRIKINGFARSYSQRGEAVVADLGLGRHVFVLLGPAFLAEEMLPHDRWSREWPRAFRAIEQLEGQGFHDLDLNRLTLRMATFEDITDPTTISVLDPLNLSKTLGEGYALVSMQIEITSAPVTLGMVEKTLPWLRAHGREYGNVKGRPTRGETYEQPNANDYTVSHSHFTTELYK